MDVTQNACKDVRNRFQEKAEEEQEQEEEEEEDD